MARTANHVKTRRKKIKGETSGYKGPRLLKDIEKTKVSRTKRGRRRVVRADTGATGLGR